jgi:nigerose phosphorylase
MDWTLRERGKPGRETIEALGARYLSANGSIGIRGTLDEARAADKPAVLINGLYDRVGSLWREPVNAPNGLYLSVACDGEELSAASSRLGSHEQSLDFRRGVQGRATVFLAASGAKVRLSSSRFASLDRRRLACAEYELESDREAELVLRAGIDAAVWDINGPHLAALSAREEEGALLVSARTAEKSIVVAVAQAFVADPAVGSDVSFELGNDGAYRVLRFRAEPGRRYRFSAFMIVADDATPQVPRCAAALRECRSAAAQGYGPCLERHAAAWEGLWAECDVAIEGDEEAQLALRFSLYHLLAVAPPAGSSLSIPARGLSGQVYKGAVFWDTEIFMLPLFLDALPEVARTLVRYRIEGLPGARRKAAEYGYEGAFFAWESQEGGEDACTLYNVNDVIKNRPIRTFFRDGQMHISADIVYALWRYVRATGDEGILLEGGAELAYECARFIVSWMYYKPGKDRYEILDVTGPDEYHERTHNDYYTNAISAWALRACLEMDALLAAKAPGDRAALVAELGIGALLESLPEVAARLYVAAPRELDLVIPQFDGYLGLDDPPMKELLSRKLHPNEYLGGGDGLARWTQVIKQADVVLALALLGGKGEEDKRIARANWAYYDGRTEHGSSLSATAYSVLAGRLGMVGEAYSYFLKSATIDLKGEGKQYVGDLYIGGTHPAANGGAWLSLYSGLLGIEAEGASLRLDPVLPGAWSSVRLRISAGRGGARRRIAATFARGRIVLEVPSEPFDEPIRVEAYGRSLEWDGKDRLRMIAEPEGK